ncbi:MAG: exodeoxyribonuclease V subunit alpha [Pseudomonadota bacterium]
MPTIESLLEAGIISHLDYYFTRTLCNAVRESDPVILVSAALTSRAALQGHVCLDIEQVAGTVLSGDGETDAVKGRVLPNLSDWLSALEKSVLVGLSTRCPLVLDGENRLYLARYFDFQERVIRSVAARVLSPGPDVDEPALSSGLDRLFQGTGPGNSGTAFQRLAAEAAVRNRFTVITGGPGTGKTFLVERILRLFHDQAEALSLAPPRIIAAAPTGKAASRLAGGSTIHRVLGAGMEGGRFRHTRDNPLVCDIMIVDESSMIDVALMARLMDAVPKEARLILLGDRNQLASVETGAVFGDICRAESLKHHVVSLEHNFRSGDYPGIDRLARAVNAGDGEAVSGLLRGGEYPELVFLDMGQSRPQDMETDMASLIREGFRPLMEAGQPGEALDCINRFRILCAHNRGHFGAGALNRIAEKVLRLQDGFDIKDGFIKRAIMIESNDYTRNLFNGETGLVIRQADRGVGAVFNGYDGRVRQFRISDLPAHGTAFAITVHKSQGSEFDTVLLVLPDTLSPVVTRELLYTGVTRAKQRVILAGNLDVIKAAAGLPVQRRSGITRGIDLAMEANAKID